MAQFHRKEVETFWKWSRLGFSWNPHSTRKQCEECDYNCRWLHQAKKHQESHTTSRGKCST